MRAGQQPQHGCLGRSLGGQLPELALPAQPAQGRCDRGALLVQRDHARVDVGRPGDRRGGAQITGHLPDDTGDSPFAGGLRTRRPLGHRQPHGGEQALPTVPALFEAADHGAHALVRNRVLAVLRGLADVVEDQLRAAAGHMFTADGGQPARYCRRPAALVPTTREGRWQPPETRGPRDPGGSRLAGARLGSRGHAVDAKGLGKGPRRKVRI